MKPGGQDETFRDERLNDRTATLHGVLVRVFGSGVLIVGESGTGKSSCALELVSRGHTLVTDDVIIVKNVEEKLVGSAPARFAGLLEVRDLGIVDVRELFGPASFAPTCAIDLCVEFVNREFLGTDPFAAEYCVLELLGTKLSKLILTASPGRSLPVLVEAAVRLARISSGLNTVAEDHDRLVSRTTA